ncbi:MAG: hypothetical protein M1412_00855 [Deltaproteobacteria bacterium]|nr:hypothetical protein [Deltaproteobacteria bacterium]MCL5891703.1 hypothetical protein [Deltaproteobacteria bacterium]
MRIILAALIFSAAVSLSGCRSGGGGGDPPQSVSYCNQNPSTKVYSCNINFTITNTAGYSQIGGVSVTVANPQ